METECDGWKLVASEFDLGADGRITFVNIVPCCGSEHTLHPGCWCEPDLEIWWGVHILTHHTEQ